MIIQLTITDAEQAAIEKVITENKWGDTVENWMLANLKGIASSCISQAKEIEIKKLGEITQAEINLIKTNRTK